MPLSDAALEVLRAQPRKGEFVFPGRTAKHVSRRGILLCLQATAERLGVRATDGGKITAHGMRSTFADWAAETGRDPATILASIAHAFGGKSDQAYLRSTNLPQRRALMAAWAAHVTGKPAEGPQADQQGGYGRAD